MLHGVDAAGEIQSLAADLRLEVFGNHKPQRGRLQALLGQIQGLLAQDLLAEEALARERDHLRGHLDVAEGGGGRPPGSLFQGLQDIEVGGGAGLRIIVGVAGCDRGDPAGQIQLLDDVGLTLMQVHGARMHLLKRPDRIHRPNEPTARFIDNAKEIPGCRTHFDVLRRIPRLRPVPAISPPAQLAALFEDLRNLQRPRPEQFHVTLPQRELGGRTAEVGGENIWVLRIDHRMLAGPGQQVLRIAHQVLVEGILQRDQHY